MITQERSRPSATPLGRPYFRNVRKRKTLFFVQRQFCDIQEMLSGQEHPHFLVAKLESFPQLISNEVSDCIPNIYGYVATFLNYVICNSIFHPWQGFSANNFASRNAILFIFSSPDRPIIP